MAENNGTTSIFFRYWVYSKTEADKLKSVNKGVSARDFKLGTVVTQGGIAKPYTSIVRNKEDIAYPDATVVSSGDIRKTHYTKHIIN